MKLTLVLLHFCIEFSQSDKLLAIVDSLSQGIGARTQIFFLAKNTTQFEHLINWTTLPQILITDAGNFTLRRRFSADILSVVMLEPYRFESTQGHLVRSTLDRWHRTDVLFVVHSIDRTSWSWLFDWCWAQGFYNVLLTDSAGALLTHEFFPTRRMRTTTLAEYLQQRNKNHNFHGYPIRVAAGNHPPRALVYKSKRSGDIVFSGLMPQLLRLFAHHFNLTLQLVLMPHFATYSIHDCLEQLRSHRVDVCADMLFLGDWYVISRPLHLYFGFLTVRYAHPVPIFRYFFAPFDRNLWLLLAAIVLGLTLLSSLVCWWQRGSWHLDRFLLAAISSILNIALSLNPIEGRLRNLLHLVHFVIGFMLSNMYLALLSSLLSTNIYERHINSLEDLRTQNITVMVNDVDRKIFEIYGVSQLILERLLEVKNEELIAHRNALDAQFAYISLMDKCELYLYQQKFLSRPRMKVLDIAVDALWGGMPMVSDWPFEEMFNRFTMRLFEVGIVRHFMDLTKEEAVTVEYIRFFKTEQRGTMPLNIEYFEMPAVLLALGYVAAVVAFILENIFRRDGTRLLRWIK